ncbi:class GN sortase [Pseudoteredinibacter isoporae]|uniref:class GN sortase n=1 Tax=Pseudoteredinibacter isoporae TaxID=570281 RepID=UPI00310B3B1F
MMPKRSGLHRFVRPRYLFGLLLFAACLPGLQGLWMLSKAQLAQYLLQQAWVESIEKGGNVRPWPWADSWPVARLRWSDANIDMLVLFGAQGSSLAFAPGLAEAANGAKMISAHRDTHFRFLSKLHVGDTIELQERDGVWQSWQVEFAEIHDINKDRLWLGEGELLLVSCYPFEQIEAGGPLRFVLRLRRVEVQTATSLTANRPSPVMGLGHVLRLAI